MMVQMYVETVLAQSILKNKYRICSGHMLELYALERTDVNNDYFMPAPCITLKIDESIPGTISEFEY